MMFMIDVINPSFVEAEVVDFVCMDIRECVDIRQSLFLFTRDVSYPATMKVTTKEKDEAEVSLLWACACLATFVGALYLLLDDEGDCGEQQHTLDGKQQPLSDDAAPDLAHANSTDSDTLAGGNASPDPPQHGVWRRLFTPRTKNQPIKRYERN